MIDRNFEETDEAGEITGWVEVMKGFASMLEFIKILLFTLCVLILQ